MDYRSEIFSDFPDVPLDEICGIDEAGRGPLAGPVTAAAVILPADYPLEELDDSKKLSPRRREVMAADLLGVARAWGIGWVWPHEIDALNIHRASLLAMERAYGEMISHGVPVGLVIVDGKFTPDLAPEPRKGSRPGGPPPACRAVVKADSFVPSVQAASILAKTARDRWMVRYSWIEPAYLYEKHKGYPTAEHARICRELGPSPIQRASFRIPDPPGRPDRNGRSGRNRTAC